MQDAQIRLDSEPAFPTKQKNRASVVSMHHCNGCAHPYQDVITGVPNRAAFERAAANTLACLGTGCEFSLHWIGVDRFRSLNETLGYQAGDAVLRIAAQRIAAILEPEEFLARVGDDEFAVIQNTSSLEEIARLNARIAAALSTPTNILGNRVSLTASAGVARAPLDGVDLEILMKRADLAYRRAKQLNRGSCCIFEEKLEIDLDASWRIAQDLELALRNGELELHYQPFLNLETSALAGFEALVRWRRPGVGLWGPNLFLPVAETHGLMNRIGGWVLKEACRVAAGLPGSLRMAVNLSPSQLVEHDFISDVAAALSSSGLSPCRLELEITESTLLVESEATRSCLSAIRRLGVSVALDDFGTGCSALSHLRAFAVDRIKIDQSFVRELGVRASTECIIRGVLSIARELGIQTTAEGVETREQLLWLKNHGCNELQGYLIGRPEPAAAPDVDVAAF